jgi:heat shock protein HslJ
MSRYRLRRRGAFLASAGLRASLTAAAIALAVLSSIVPGAATAQSPSPSPLADASPPVAEAGMAGTAWSVLSIGPTPTSLEQSVEFGTDGTLAIMTGCATYRGTYVVEEGALTVEGLRRDLGSVVACAPGDQGQADLLRKVLESSASWTIDDHGLLSIEAGADYAGWRLALEARSMGTDEEADASVKDMAAESASPSAAAE